MLKYMSAVAVALVLSGCISSEVTMMDERTALISATGADFATSAGVTKRVLMEAAELSQQKGFDYFVILASKDTSRSGTTVVSTPVMGRTNCSLTPMGGGAASASCRSMTTGGPQVVSYYDPGLSVMVRMYREGEDRPTDAWKVSTVLASKKK